MPPGQPNTLPVGSTVVLAVVIMILARVVLTEIDLDVDILIIPIGRLALTPPSQS